MLTTEIEKNYDAKKIEDKWYTEWVEKGYFKANVKSKKKPFVIVIPPPNITAVLHMGHAYNNTIQDILIRWKRLQGYEALYQPGTDHAGIATQTVVERKLREAGTSRKELGREKFVEHVWKWREHYGNKIIDQLKKLGISAEWERERFTLDEGLSEAVQEVFIDLYNKGLIYKGNRIVNWDPVSGTAIADDEVEHKDIDGKLYHLRYNFVDSNEFITVATTRPETLFGDTGIAISPEDERKYKYLNRKVIIPFVNREVKIFSDDHVDKDFGSGFVKTTPAHDPNDFEMGKRHNLDQIIVMDKEAKILSVCQKITGNKYSDELPIPDEFIGLDRYAARKLIIQRLDDMGQLEGIDKHPHSVGHSYRSKVAIEPYLSEQWFVKMKPLAKNALKALKSGEIKFYPEGRYEKTYEHWMNNIRDWCISRQLWWGHRIPAWYNDKGELKVCKYDPSTDEQKWQQENDVLDTWFSSWLWPFSTMGWPNKTDDLNYFYPSSVLVTASDIIFFWVARMIMAGYEFLGERPFHTVYFNGIVRDSQGRKMSKSLGNGIDPLELIEQYSTDSVRYTVVQLSSQGQDIKVSENDFEIGRNFSNKIWNSFRFLSMNLPEKYLFTDETLENLDIADQWILSQFQKTISNVTENLERYRFQTALSSIYSFYWHSYCDWYLELIKPRLHNSKNQEDKKTALAVASYIMKNAMILFHPFMPFISEEIWHFFRDENDSKSIMISKWLQYDKKFHFPESEKKIEFIRDLIVKIRNIRAEMNIPVKSRIQLNVKSTETTSYLRENSSYFSFLARVDTIQIMENFVDTLSAKFILSQMEFQIPLKDVINIDKEKKRISSELAKKEAILKGTLAKLSNERFLTAAPVNVVEHERKKVCDIESDIKKLKNNLENFN